MDARLDIVEIFVVYSGAFNDMREGLESVRLRVKCIATTGPWKIVTKENAGHADALQFIVRRVGVLYEVPPLDTLLADEIRHSKSQKTAKFFEPSSAENVIFRRAGRPSVFMLRVLSPNDQRDAQLYGDANRNREDSHMLG